MKKLWEKNWKLKTLIEIFETEDDLVMDQKLIKYDVLGSIAHAKMLEKVGILSQKELEKLEKGLWEVLNLSGKGKFRLQLGDEDMHTKIENYLTDAYGVIGQKIHTGRSRNDQILTALRLYSKDQLKEIYEGTKALVKAFQAFSKKYGAIAMPGYTHMQKAMPSSIKIWAESFSESLQDDLITLTNAIKLTNQSPLGSAAGYGVPINIDRKYSAKLLGFRKVQNNALYCQNSKGKIEAIVVAAILQVLLTLNKFASDVMLFTTTEFNYFIVSKELTTGSSIMPQKKNVDLAELLRSKANLVLGNYVQIVSLSTNLISGYNRDLQDSKKPLIESLETTLNCVKVSKILLEGLSVNKEALKKSMTKEIFAAEKAFELVKKGVPFRKAYQEVKNYEIKK